MNSLCCCLLPFESVSLSHHGCLTFPFLHLIDPLSFPLTYILLDIPHFPQCPPSILWKRLPHSTPPPLLPLSSPFLLQFLSAWQDSPSWTGLRTLASFKIVSFIRTLKSRNHSLLSSAGRCHLLHYPSHLAEDRYGPPPSLPALPGPASSCLPFFLSPPSLILHCLFPNCYCCGLWEKSHRLSELFKRVSFNCNLKRSEWHVQRSRSRFLSQTQTTS